MVAGHGFDDEGDESRQEARYQKRPHHPDEDLTADNDAPQIHVLLLLLLLCCVSSKGRDSADLPVPAPVIVRRGICRYLQRAAPRIPVVHTHAEFPSSFTELQKVLAL